MGWTHNYFGDLISCKSPLFHFDSVTFFPPRCHLFSHLHKFVLSGYSSWEAVSLEIHVASFHTLNLIHAHMSSSQGHLL